MRAKLIVIAIFITTVCIGQTHEVTTQFFNIKNKDYSFNIPYIFSIDKIIVRPFFEYNKLFYQVRQKARALNEYKCRHAAYDFWSAAKESGDDSKIVIGEIYLDYQFKVRSAGTFDRLGESSFKKVGDLHAIVYKNGRYYDPTADRITFAVPLGFKVIAKYDSKEQMPTEWDWDTYH